MQKNGYSYSPRTECEKILSQSTPFKLSKKTIAFSFEFMNTEFLLADIIFEHSVLDASETGRGARLMFRL